MTPEGKVKALIKAKLDADPYIWYFMPVAGVMGKAGVPDFIGVRAGRFFAIEAKADKGKPTKLQQRTMGDISFVGGVTVVISGVQEAAVFCTESIEHRL